MEKKEALEKIVSLKAALPAASEEIDEIVKDITSGEHTDKMIEDILGE